MFERRFHPNAAHPLARAAALAALTLLGAACGAKVVVDDATGGGGGNGGNGPIGAGGNGPIGGELQCGDEPMIGKIVAVCVSMDGDFCPPAQTTPGLLGVLANAMGVCTETNPTACCNQPALRQVVCDLAPVGSECCYHAHYIENVVCQ